MFLLQSSGMPCKAPLTRVVTVAHRKDAKGNEYKTTWFDMWRIAGGKADETLGSGYQALGPIWKTDFDCSIDRISRTCKDEDSANQLHAERAVCALLSALRTNVFRHGK